MDKKPQAKRLTKDMLFCYALSGGVITEEAFAKQFNREFSYRNFRQHVNKITEELGPLVDDRVDLSKINEEIFKKYNLNAQANDLNNLLQYSDGDKAEHFLQISTLKQFYFVEGREIDREFFEEIEDGFLFLTPLEKLNINAHIKDMITKAIDVMRKKQQRMNFASINYNSHRDEECYVEALIHKIIFLQGQYYLICSLGNEKKTDDSTKSNFIVYEELEAIPIYNITHIGDSFQKSTTIIDKNNQNERDFDLLGRNIADFLKTHLVSKKNIKQSYQMFKKNQFYIIYASFPNLRNYDKNSRNKKNIARYFKNISYLRTQQEVTLKELEDIGIRNVEKFNNEATMFKFKVLTLNDFDDIINQWQSDITIYKIVNEKEELYDIENYLKGKILSFSNFINRFDRYSVYKDNRKLFLETTFKFLLDGSKGDKNLSESIEDILLEYYLNDEKRVKHLREKLEEK